MLKALTIAGSDPSGGAGIQADLKTFMAFGLYGMSVITSVTAQNTLGVYAVQDVATDIVEKQLDAVFSDIFPDCVKIGMVSSCSIIEAIAKKLRQYRPKNVVLDPVMISTSGHELIDSETAIMLFEKLVPLSDVITPNIPEAEALCGFKISGIGLQESAARRIAQNYSGAILIKGGHLTGPADDLLLANGKIIWIKGKRIDTKNTHGTGCTLSSALAAALAQGFDISEAAEKGKRFVTLALESGLSIGNGCGPLDHLHGAGMNG